MLPHMEGKQEQEPELPMMLTTYHCKVMVTHVVVGAADAAAAAAAVAAAVAAAAAAAVRVHIYSGDIGWNRSSRGASHNSSRSLHFDS